MGNFFTRSVQIRRAVTTVFATNVFSPVLRRTGGKRPAKQPVTEIERSHGWIRLLVQRASVDPRSIKPADSREFHPTTAGRFVRKSDEDKTRFSAVSRLHVIKTCTGTRNDQRRNTRVVHTLFTCVPISRVSTPAVVTPYYRAVYAVVLDAEKKRHEKWYSDVCNNII